MRGCCTAQRGYVAELCAQAHAILPHRGRVVAAAALSAAEGSGSRRSAVYVGFPLCACAPYGRCEGAFFQGNRPIEQPKAPKIPVGSQSSRRLAALGAPAARKTRPSSFDTCQVKVQHLIRALPQGLISTPANFWALRQQRP